MNHDIAYAAALQRVSVLQNAGNACIYCGGYGYAVPQPEDYAKERCMACKGTGEATTQEAAP